MSPLQWVLLGVIFTVYLLFGGSIFMVLEQGNELREHAQLSLLRKDVQEILLHLDRDFYHNETLPEVIDAVHAAKEGVINRISETCGNINLLDEHSVSTIRWTFYNSVFFAFTAMTTIGYGNLAPDTQWSRIFTIFYALIGIPINGVLITNLSDFFSNKLVKAHKNSKGKESKLSFIFNIIFYLIPGLLIFIIAPAGFFVMIENWTYSDAIYFSFVTLTTIGFGDYVAGMGDGHNIWLWIYKVVIIIWIVFGLGYLVMILGFITKGMTSKKVRVVLGKRLNRIRITKEKLSRDVEFIRKVVNEIYLMKAEPVEDGVIDFSAQRNLLAAKEQMLGLRRTQSFQIVRAKTAQNTSAAVLHRSLSEGDLENISKFKGLPDYGQESEVDPRELLAHLVTSLQGNISDVIDAVNELSEIEDGDEAFESDDLVDDEEDLNVEPRPEFENMPPAWELGMLTESDEEILIDDDDDEGECLKQVVVHKPDNSKLSTPQGIMDKVNNVLRKISTGTKNSSEAGSRKVSRNETEAKNRIIGSSAAPKISRNSSQESVCDFPHGPPGCSTGLKMNYGSSISGSPSLAKGFHLTPGSSKSSINNSSYPNTPSIQRKISKEEAKRLDPASLVDFLKALDSVQGRLKNFDDNLQAGDSDRTYSPSCQDGGQYNAGFSIESSCQSTPPEKRFRIRRRKVGVFNPEFKYFIPEVPGNSIKKDKDPPPDGDGKDISFL